MARKGFLSFEVHPSIAAALIAALFGLVWHSVSESLSAIASHEQRLQNIDRRLDAVERDTRALSRGRQP